MIKRFLVALLKTIIGLAVCSAIVVGAVSYIYNEFYLDPQILIDEYEEIAKEQPVSGMVIEGGDLTDETTEPTPEPTPTPTPAPDWPTDIDVTSWEFILANANNDIGTYKPDATKYFDGCLMDMRIVDAAKAMVSEARSGGYDIALSTGYQDYNTIKTAYEKALAAGSDVTTAEISAPGTNEHQTGLGIDILSSTKGTKDLSFEDKPICGWLQRHCAEYGFILRYPEGKEDITGVEYSPWHYRYVGVTAATYIMEKGICLEEFLALYGVQNTSAAAAAEVSEVTE